MNNYTITLSANQFIRHQQQIAPSNTLISPPTYNHQSNVERSDCSYTFHSEHFTDQKSQIAHEVTKFLRLIDVLSPTETLEVKQNEQSNQG